MALLAAPTRICVRSALFLFQSSLLIISAAPALEYEVKAAYLINLFAYIEWPVPQPGPRTVCVLGRDPFGQLLDRTAEKNTSFPITVKRLGEGQNAKGCDILFVAQGSLRRNAGVLEEMVRQGVLTVGERDDASADGSVVVLETNERDKRVTIAVNPVVAKSVGFRISSRLLAIARLIKASEVSR